MRLISFLTFVVFLSCWAGLAVASPDSEIHVTRPSIKPEDDASIQSATLLRSRTDRKTMRMVGVGSMGGSLVDKGVDRTSSFVSFTQTNSNSDLSSQNFGLEALEIGLLGAHWGFRTLVAMNEWFEPYYQLGAGALYKPQESLATLINYERYQVRASVGFEDLFRQHRNFRLDMTVATSPLGLSYQASLLYNMTDPAEWFR